jgi:5-methylcytosine-specific restriction protein A
MPLKSLRACKVPGCPNLVRGPGYCPDHADRARQDTRDRFRRLDERVTPEARRFYQSASWTEVSRLHRTREPLCRRCKKNGRIVAGELVHHDPPLAELLRDGKNPLSDEYLETLCMRCHQAELSSRATAR